MDELAKRFAELAERYGPAVADAAKGAARVEAYSALVGGAMAALFGIGLVTFAVWLHRRHDWDEMRYVFVGLGGVFGLIFLAAGLWQWVDPWTWTTISQPELWIAKRAFRL